VLGDARRKPLPPPCRGRLSSREGTLAREGFSISCRGESISRAAARSFLAASRCSNSFSSLPSLRNAPRFAVISRLLAAELRASAMRSRCSAGGQYGCHIDVPVGGGAVD